MVHSETDSKLNNWLRNPSNDFKIKIGLFVTIKLTRNAIKSKFIYNGRGWSRFI